MAIKNSISNDFLSTFVDSIDVFDFHLPGVFTRQQIFCKAKILPNNSMEKDSFRNSRAFIITTGYLSSADHICSLESDQARQTIRPDLDPNCLVLMVFQNECFEKVNFEKQQHSRRQSKSLPFIGFQCRIQRGFTFETRLYHFHGGYIIFMGDI